VTEGRRRTGRRPGAADTRGRILDAARGVFGRAGYDGASVRAIAAEAGVDPALVHHYFGSKQRLFLAAMEFPIDPAVVLPRVLAEGPRATLGERFVAFVVALWDRPDVRPLLTGVVRSATTDPVAAGMARRFLAEGPFLALASATDRPDASLRAALAGSQMIGLAIARYVVGVEPLASLAPEGVARLVGPAVQRYLDGDLGDLGDPGDLRGRGGDPGVTPPAPRG
jgi:AcrR family transcriptional regulator